MLSPDRSSVDMRSRHQRAGFLWKLPMSKPSSEKWQKRMFVAKDGYLLYYGGTAPANPSNFDTKPKGVIPLGGSKVELIERGPKGCKFGLKVTHPDFLAGRALVLAAETADAQTQWKEALEDCSRVTMENAKLGDSMVERLRAEGTAAEAEKEAAMIRLQEQAMALKAEQDAKLALLNGQDAILKEAAQIEERAKAKEIEAAQIEERAKAKEVEMTAALALVESRRAELEKQAAEIQAEIESRNSALSGATAEYEKIQLMLEAARSVHASGPTTEASASSVASMVASAPTVHSHAASVPLAAVGVVAHTTVATTDSVQPLVPAAAVAANISTPHASVVGSSSVAATSGAGSSSAPRATGATAHPAVVAAAASVNVASTASANGSSAIPVHRVPSESTMAAAASMSAADIARIEARARQLEEEKMRLEGEKRVLERSVKDMTATTANLRTSLVTAEEARKLMQDQLAELNSEEGDLLKERQLRKRLERKLQIAEESLKRLDSALRRNGVRMDVDVFADVKTLLSFFEERVDEARRDAHRIDIMKKALKAKRRYLVASANADGGGVADEDDDAENVDDDTWGDERPAPAPVAARQAPAPAPAPAAAVRSVPAPVQAAAAATMQAARVPSTVTTTAAHPPLAAATLKAAAATPVPHSAPPPAPAKKVDVAPERDEEGWDEEEEEASVADDAHSEDAASMDGAPGVTADVAGPLPTGWTMHTDEEGDNWYFNADTGETSWVRPNADGTVPAP